MKMMTRAAQGRVDLRLAVLPRTAAESHLSRPVAVAVHPGGRVKTDGQLTELSLPRRPAWTEPYLITRGPTSCS